jgi:hypothetical protein
MPCFQVEIATGFCPEVEAAIVSFFGSFEAQELNAPVINAVVPIPACFRKFLL